MDEWLRVIDEVGDVTYVAGKHYDRIRAGMHEKIRALEVTDPVGTRIIMDCRRIAMVRAESVDFAVKWADWRYWINDQLPDGTADDPAHDWGSGA